MVSQSLLEVSKAEHRTVPSRPESTGKPEAVAPL